MYQLDLYIENVHGKNKFYEAQKTSSKLDDTKDS